MSRDWGIFRIDEWPPSSFSAFFYQFLQKLYDYNRQMPNQRRNGFFVEPIPELTSETSGPRARDLSCNWVKKFGNLFRQYYG